MAAAQPFLFFCFPLLFLFLFSSYDHRPENRNARSEPWPLSLHPLCTQYSRCSSGCTISSLCFYLLASTKFLWVFFRLIFFFGFLGVIRRFSFQKNWKFANTKTCNLLSDSIFGFELFLFFSFLHLCLYFRVAVMNLA